MLEALQIHLLKQTHSTERPILKDGFDMVLHFVAGLGMQISAVESVIDFCARAVISTALPTRICDFDALEQFSPVHSPYSDARHPAAVVALIVPCPAIAGYGIAAAGKWRG